MRKRLTATVAAIALLAGGFAAGRVDVTSTDPGACASIQWDRITPVDINRDGKINCSSDRELGA